LQHVHPPDAACALLAPDRFRPGGVLRGARLGTAGAEGGLRDPVTGSAVRRSGRRAIGQERRQAAAPAGRVNSRSIPTAIHVTASPHTTMIIVSNRLPITVVRDGRKTVVRRSAGGLVSALEPMLAQRGGTWVGWWGSTSETPPELPADQTPYRIVG